MHRLTVNKRRKHAHAYGGSYPVMQIRPRPMTRDTVTQLPLQCQCTGMVSGKGRDR